MKVLGCGPESYVWGRRSAESKPEHHFNVGALMLQNNSSVLGRLPEMHVSHWNTELQVPSSKYLAHKLEANLRLPPASGQSLQTAAHLECCQLQEAPGSRNRLMSRANALWGHLDITVSLLKSKPQLFPWRRHSANISMHKEPFTAVLETESEAWICFRVSTLG